MIVARLSTTHFEFVVLGEDKAQASVTMLDTLRQHGKDYDCDTMWFLAWEDDVQYFDLAPGQGMRDGTVIHGS